MLGRTAQGIFWMFRYLERSENVARLIEAGFRIALTRSAAAEDEWASIVTTAGVRQAYLEKHETFAPSAVINFLLRDRSNPSSVLTAIEMARSNARSVRTALTQEASEATNECWMTLKAALTKPIAERDLPSVLALIRQQNALVRGSVQGTMLRNDIYGFASLGTFLERADNTARILDVKYYVLLPSVSHVGSSLDNVQWETILRSVSAHHTYNWLNEGDLNASGIAKFLILDSRMPRSLTFCSTKIVSSLGYLARDYHMKHACHDQAGPFETGCKGIRSRRSSSMDCTNSSWTSSGLTISSAGRSSKIIASTSRPMRLSIDHHTNYAYDRPVSYGLQQLRLTPKSRAGQEVVRWIIAIEGGKVELEFDDQHNNRVSLVSTEAGQREIKIHCQGEVINDNATGVIGLHGGYAPLWYFERSTPLTKPGPLLRKLARTFDGDNDVGTLHALSKLILSRVAYETGTTHSETTAENALALGRGVCQDHAQIFITAARLLGFPARYVSGYLFMEDRVQQEASHGWAEAFVEGLGWVGFDVANGISPDERYIRVATGLDYKEAAPVSGLRFGTSGETMSVELQVEQ